MAKTDKTDKTDKTEKTETKNTDAIYSARLKVGDTQLASITIVASSDEDAKEQLSRAKPTYFEGVGEWSLTKRETVEVK